MKVGVIVTGGTIASTLEPSGSGLYAPRCGSELREATRKMGAAHGYDVVIEQWADFQGAPMPLLDSCDVEGKHWQMMAAQAQRLLKNCVGVVILHGTDTLAYTASALGMMGIAGGPVVVTGAQVPLVAEGTDALDNLQLALDTAAGRFGNPGARVLVAFGQQIMSGVRVTKHSTRSFTGFKSWNSTTLPCPPGGSPDCSVFGSIASREPPAPALTDFAGGVLFLRVAPGLDLEYIERIFTQSPPRGLVLELFGVGSAPRAERLAQIANRLAERNVPVVAVSSCDHGGIDWGRYEATAPLKASACIDGHDMTGEAALVKLQGLLARHDDLTAITRDFVRPIANEMSIDDDNT